MGSQIPEVSKREVEAKLASVGDYVKMDYLQACLKKQLDFETRKFVMVKLSELYDQKGMYAEAGRLIRASADINTTYDKKIDDFLKSMDLFIRGGVFDEAEISFNKALASGNDRQKQDIKVKYKEIYKKYAKIMMQKDKRKNAMQTYERLAMLDLNAAEKEEVNKNLLDLYQKLGKVKEFYSLKRKIDGAPL